MDALAQGAILFFGVVSVWLVGSRSQRARFWGCVAGLAGQPFWMLVTLRAEQWGIFVLACWYTVSWARGIKNAWRVKE